MTLVSDWSEVRVVFKFADAPRNGKSNRVSHDHATSKCKNENNVRISDPT